MSYYRLYFRDYGATSVAVVSSKRMTKLTQSEEPTACVRDSRSSEVVYQGRGRALNAHRQIGFFGLEPILSGRAV